MGTDFDLIVIGGGTAGMSAAQYGARAGLRVALLEELASGGQALLIDSLENYPGIAEPVSGFELTQRMEEQAARFGAEIRSATVSAVRKEASTFLLETSQGALSALAVIAATGAKHRTLGVPGEAELAGKGVSYCATCDGPFFKGKRMVVVGGGDAACDEAMFLSKLTGSILMLHRKDKFRAQKALAQRVLSNPVITVRFESEVLAILGNGSVRGVRIRDNSAGREYEEPAEAVFVFIGSLPQTSLLAGVELDEGGYVLTDQRMQTRVPGLYAAGDVRSSPFRQIVVAAAEGAIAAHAAGQFIDELKGEAYR